MSEERPQIYDQNLMHHYQNPHNRGKLGDPDLRASAENPRCGDKIDLELNLKDEVVSDIKFDGEGCVVCIGSASILTQLTRGLTLERAKDLKLADLQANMNDSRGEREDCMSVALHALHKALSKED
ncbi:MAG: iron-sulfur cluster assembly scaffold protein [Candidatus Acetothermia bacterium]